MDGSQGWREHPSSWLRQRLGTGLGLGPLVSLCQLFYFRPVAPPLLGNSQQAVGTQKGAGWSAGLHAPFVSPVGSPPEPGEGHRPGWHSHPCPHRECPHLLSQSRHY